MKSGVSSSGSPNQNASTSLLPRLAFATSRIFDPRKRNTASRAVSSFSGTENWGRFMGSVFYGAFACSVPDGARWVSVTARLDPCRSAALPWHIDWRSVNAARNHGDSMSDDDLKAEVERLRKENESLKKGAARGVSLKVSEKGGLSV